MREFTAEHALEHDVLVDALVDGAATGREPAGPFDDDEAIDQVLRLVADHHRSLGALIGRRAFSPTLAELRQSPLGRDLRLLAAGARGDAPAAAIEAASGRVVEALLRPLAADDYRIPDWFWTTAVGRMVARARREGRGRGAFVPLAAAAERLGVDRATLERWAADGALPTLPDERGRPLVARDELERRQAIRLAFAVQDLTPERPDDVVVTERRLAS